MSKTIYKISFNRPCLRGKPRGSKHDFTLFKEEFKQDWLEAFFLCVDLGYQGIDKHFSCQGLIQGIKRKKGQKLSEDEKEFNQRVSQLRIKVEHAIAGLKRYRILYDKLRVKSLQVADLVVELGAGLWNYYLKSKTIVVTQIN